MILGGCPWLRNYHFKKKTPAKLLLLAHWKKKSDKKRMAQLWLFEIKFGSENFGCSTQTADWKPKSLHKHIQTVLQRSKIHLRSCMPRLLSCRPAHLSIRLPGSIGEDRLWSTPLSQRAEDPFILGLIRRKTLAGK